MISWCYVCLLGFMEGCSHFVPRRVNSETNKYRNNNKKYVEAGLANYLRPRNSFNETKFLW